MIKGKIDSYVVGLAFSKGMKYLLLIEKNRPETQKGKLNGVGGHISESECPIDAMIREFYEETGIKTSRAQWKPLLKISGPGKKRNQLTGEIFFFHAELDIEDCRSKTDEKLIIIPVAMIGNFEVVADLQWLIPMAIDPDTKESFSIFLPEEFGVQVDL